MSDEIKHNFFCPARESLGSGCVCGAYRSEPAPLIPQSRAEEMVEAERQACEDISARVSDDNNCGCGVGFAIVSAICSRAPSPERQKKETGR